MSLPSFQLKDIAESVSYGITASACNTPVGPKFLRITDIQDNKVDWDNVPWCEISTNSINEAKLQRGDIVFARTGATTGKSYLIKGCPTDTIFASYLIRVRLGRTADPQYVSHFFQTSDYWAQITKNARGVAQPGVNATILKKLQIPLPPLPEQKRIAAILDATDELRTKRRESIALLDDLIQSTFLEMFGDPVTNPMRWMVKTLGEILKVKSGNGLVAKDMNPDGKYPVYGGNGINGYHDSYMFDESQIVLGRVGVYCGVVHLTKPKAWVTDNALYVHRVFQPIDTTYLVSILKNANLNQYAGQAAQPLISGNRIYPVSILLPPVDLQQRYSMIVESIEKQKARLQTHLDELNILFASLQQRAFNGEL